MRATGNVRTFWSRRSAAQKLRVLVWTVGVAAAVLLTGAAAVVAGDRSQLDAAFVVIALATLCVDALSVDLRVGRHIESFTWAELTVVLGLATLQPAAFILTALCVGIAYVVTRRSLVKIVYNTASYAVGIALALCSRLIAVPTWNRPVASAVALTVGAVTFSLWNAVSIDAAIALSQDLPFREVQSRGARLRLVVCVGNIALGLVVLTVEHENPGMLVVLPLILAGAYAAYRSYLRTIQERAIWRHLDATSQEINRLDERAVIDVALARATSLFEADDVGLVLNPTGLDAKLAGCLNVRTLRGEAEHTLVHVPMMGRDSQIGILALRFSARIRLTDRELRLLRTFAHTISTSVENARLYAEMTQLAAHHETAARHDPLTELPNRVVLYEHIAELLASSEDPRFALMILDLDHFKDVNDGLGHSIGDAVLHEVAAHLSRAVRQRDIVCRLGGDEFAILVSDADAAPAVGERLLAALDQPIQAGTTQLAIGGSIGYACAPEDGASVEELLHHADVAMYRAKGRRGSICRYTKARDDAAGTPVDRLNLIGELRTALRCDQFELRYQPQLDLTTGVATGAEALVRWRHPTRGLLEPKEFISLVETSSLVRDFTNRVLDLAVAECATWQSSGRRLTIAVNLSASNIADERLADDVHDTLCRHSLDPELLVLEITETAMHDDLSFVEEQMSRLAKLGVSLSIDDFGTGSSSLTFLQRVMVHELKIDRSFVAGMVDNEHDAAITRATVSLAQSLGLRTVAEGVEDPLVAQALIDLRCDCAQGYLWSRPVPAADARRVLGVDQPRALASTPAG